MVLWSLCGILSAYLQPLAFASWCATYGLDGMGAVRRLRSFCYFLLHARPERFLASTDPGRAGGGSGVAGGVALRMMAGMVLLVTPELLQLLGGRRLSANEVTLTCCLCPVVIAVAGAALGAEQEQLTHRLWPGLAGLAGLLSFVPLPAFPDVRFALALGVLPLAIGIGATFFGARTRNGQDGSERLAITLWSPSNLSLLGWVLGVSSLTFALLAALRHAGPQPFPYAAAVYDGLTDALSLAVLLRFGAERWSAHFLLGPCLTVVMGVLLLRPRVDSRTVLGIGLLAAGGWSLLSARSAHADE